MQRQTVLAIATTLISSCLSICVFLAGDIYFAYWSVSRPDPHVQMSNVHIQDELLGWRPEPGALGRHAETGSFDVEYRINENGFKATPETGTPRFRIYFFGDSYTFGHGVRNVDTYPNIIADQYLNNSIHVLNAGVMGYGIEQMYGYFLQLVADLQPGDIVVFAPTSQDIKRNLKDFVFPAKLIFTKRFASRYPYYEAGHLSSVELATPWNTFKAFMLNGRLTKHIFRFMHRALTQPKTTLEAVEMLGAVRSLTEERKARFALFFLPQTKERLRGTYEEDVSAFTFLDVMNYFPSEPAELAKIRFKTDTHWNRAGHAIAARAIVETLVQEGFIDRRQLQSAQPSPGGRGRKTAHIDLSLRKRDASVNQIIERINLSPPQTFD